MKPDIHPSNYRKVVFKDMSCDHSFLVHSCVNTKKPLYGKMATSIRCTNWKFLPCLTPSTLASKI